MNTANTHRVLALSTHRVLALSTHQVNRASISTAYVHVAQPLPRRINNRNSVASAITGNPEGAKACLRVQNIRFTGVICNFAAPKSFPGCRGMCCPWGAKTSVRLGKNLTTASSLPSLPLPQGDCLANNAWDSGGEVPCAPRNTWSPRNWTGLG